MINTQFNHVQILSNGISKFTFKGEASSDASDRNKVGYLAAGGTINTEKKDGVNVGSNDVIKRLFNDFKNKVRMEDSPFTIPLDSSNFNRDLQYKLNGAVSNDIYSHVHLLTGKKGNKTKDATKIPGEIVTHGSDTLEENSALLAYERLPAPVIYTASWAGPFELGSDAVQNIEKAEKLANNSKTPPGVFVVIGNEIHLATRVHKVNTHPWISIRDKDFPDTKSYFVSIDSAPVGKFDDNGNVVFNSDFLSKWSELLQSNPLKKYNIDMTKGIKPAYVEHMIVDENSDLADFKDLAGRLSNFSSNERRGAIIEGDLPNSMEIANLINKLNSNPNILIVNSKDFKGLFPIQARIKLAALLGMKEIPTADVPQLMKTNIAGEILTLEGVEKSKWRIPKAFSDRGEFIVAFPGMDRQIVDDAISRLSRKPTDKEKILLINGYGDGNLPIGYMNMEERLKLGFAKINRLQFAQKIIENITADASGKEPDFSLPNVILHTQQLLAEEGNVATEAAAKNLLKKAFVETNGILSSLASAKDKGISIKIGVKPDYATPNLHAYEIGTILEIIGAESTGMPTRKFMENFNN